MTVTTPLRTPQAPGTRAESAKSLALLRKYTEGNIGTYSGCHTQLLSEEMTRVLYAHWIRRQTPMEVYICVPLQSGRDRAVGTDAATGLLRR